ncbi:MAG: adenylate/guanylate cyclase domain-containing protein [Bacteroidetes bacterium]|nr:adenylate/guanylate cyclase domain-containing protein [Bacteroidota bacterium]
MALKDDLTNKISSYFNEPYEIEETKLIPGTDYSKLTFGNKALVSELAFMFADIRNSSELHSTYGFKTAARIYQSFHDITVRVVESQEGKVRAFDGDRVMGVFAGDYKCSNAATAAMKIKWAVENILNSELTTPIKVGMGVDYGNTLITKVGKGRDSNNNDLVWIGKACNYASHLSGYGKNQTILTTRAYNKIAIKKSSKGEEMWTKSQLTLKDNTVIDVYKSNWGWVIN